jgi:hypothetical protein
MFFHWRAAALAEAIVKEQPRIVTTQAVLVEIGNALAAPRRIILTVSDETQLLT